MKAIILFALQAQRWFVVYGLQQSAFIMLISATAMVPRLALAQNLFEPYQISGQQVLFGDVLRNGLQISADSRHVVYVADQNTNEVFDLFSVPITGGTSVQLNNTLPSGGTISSNRILISPDSSRVIYLAEQNTVGVVELFSVPIEGGTPVRLNEPLPSGGNVSSASLQISADSSRVVYLADQNIDGVQELFSAPIAGGTPVRLNDFLPPGGSVSTNGVHLSADSSRVIYLGTQITAGVFELFSVPITGGAPVRLNSPLPFGGIVFTSGLQISPDSSRVIYFSDQITDNVRELFSVPIHGGSPVRLNAPLPSNGNVNGFGIQISADSSRVTYIADQNTDEVRELFSVPISGGTPVRLNSTLPSGGEVFTEVVLISPDSSHVVYLAEQNTNDVRELFSVPINGGTPVQLNSILPFGGGITHFGLKISADSSRVVYVDDQFVNNEHELFSVPITGGPLTRLNSSLPIGGDIFFFNLYLSADSSTVVYWGDQNTLDVHEVFSVPISGGTPKRLNDALPFGADIESVRLSNNGQFVVYLGDQEVFDEIELFAVKIAESASADELCLPIKTKAGSVVVICL